MINKCSFLWCGASGDAKVTERAHLLRAEKLPRSEEEGAYRNERNAQRNTNLGLDAWYDPWDGNEFKHLQLESPKMFSKERPSVLKFFAVVRRDLTNNYRDPTPWEHDNDETASNSND